MLKNNKKAFTLIEVLAIIVVLAIITLIAVPNINGYLEKSRKQSFETGVESLIRAYEYEKMEKGDIGRVSPCYLNTNKCNFEGYIESDEEDKTFVYLTNNTYCAIGTVGFYDVKKGNCSTESTVAPVITEITIMDVTISSAKVIVDFYEEGILKSVKFRLLDGETNAVIENWRSAESIDNSSNRRLAKIEYKNLVQNKKYKVEVEVKNNGSTNNTATSSKTFETLGFDAPLITYSHTWEKEKNVTITFADKENLTNRYRVLTNNQFDLTGWKDVTGTSKSILITNYHYYINAKSSSSGVNLTTSEQIGYVDNENDINNTKPRIEVIDYKNAIAVNTDEVTLKMYDTLSGVGSYCISTVNDVSNCVGEGENTELNKWVLVSSEPELREAEAQHHLENGGVYYAFVKDYVGNLSESFTFTTYKITYNLNGGTGNVPHQIKVKGTTLTLTDRVPTRQDEEERFEFLGWDTSNSVHVATYASQDDYTADSNITLNAIWRRPVTVTYNKNGGTDTVTGTVENSSCYKYNAEASCVIKLRTNGEEGYARTGYAFQDWASAQNGAATYRVNTEYSFNGNTTLYAGWKANNLVLKNQRFNYIFDTENQTITTMERTTNGNGRYTYSEVSEKDQTNANTAYISIAQNGDITLSGSIPAGTYTYVVRTTSQISNNVDSHTSISQDATMTIVVSSYDIAQATIEDVDPIIYTSHEIKPEPKVTVKTSNDATVTELVKGVDFDYTYSNNINKGTATITIVGKNNYRGSNSSRTFEIEPYDVDFAVIGDIADYIYGRDEKKPKPTITALGNTLRESTEFTYSYENNIQAGTATVIISGVGNYTGSKSKDFTINPYDLAGATIDNIATLTYNGKNQTPLPVVRALSVILEKDSDYTVSYTNNKLAGTATVTVTGKGNYAGTKSKNFTIQPRAIVIRSGSAEKVYDGTDLTSPRTVSVVSGGDILADGHIIYVTNTGKIKNVGTTANTLSEVIVEDEYENDVTSSYSITKQNGTLTVTPRPVEVEWSNTSLTYNAAQQKPTASTTTGVSGEVVTFNVSNAQTNQGTYHSEATCASVTNSSCNNYTFSNIGTDYTINKFDIANAVIADIDSLVYNRNPQEPLPVVTANGKTLVKETDYTVSYSNNIEKGIATVTVTGKGNFKGTKTKNFEITAFDLADATIDDIEALTYNGSNQTPAPVVRALSTVLVRNTDYTVSYSNNKLAGTATVTVTGKGNYKGTNSKNFTINRKPIVVKSGSAEKIYDSIALTSEHTGSIVSGGEELAEGHTIYVTNTGTITNVGSTANTLSTVVVKDENNNDVTTSYNITKQNGTLTVTPRSVAVVWTNTSLTYNASAQKPTASTTTGITGQTVTFNVSNAKTDQGTYTSEATCASVSNSSCDNYTFTNTTTEYTINKFDIKNATIANIDSYVFGRDEKKPLPVVTANGKTLVKDTDYTVSYTNNTNAGTATVTITGKGNFKGTNSKTFEIIAFDLSGSTIDDIAALTYNGAARTPEPVVTALSTTLVKDTDYTVSYTNNTNAGTATVTVTGKGNYKGTQSKNFIIDGFDVAGATIATIDDKTYAGVAYTPEPQVTALGKTLTKGTDFTYSYSNNTNAGTATVTITGKGNYKGSNSTRTFVILKKAVTIKASDQSKTYDGKTLSADATCSIAAGGLVDGHTKTCTTSGSRKDKGSSTKTLSGVVIKDASNNVVTNNYNITMQNGTIKINAKSVAVVWSNTSLTYNASAQKPTASATGVNSEVITLEVSNEQADQGTYQATASCTAVSNSGACTNYSFTNTTTDYTIAKYNLSNATIASMSDQVYTGSEIKLTPQVTALGLTLSSTKDFSYSYSSNINVGTATVTITARDGSNYTGTNSKTFKITQKPIIVLSGTASKTYDGTALTNNTAGLASDSNPMADTSHVLYVTNSGTITNVGTVDNTISSVVVKDSKGTDITSNYSITKRSGKLTINPKEVSVVWSNTTLNYNRSAQKPTATVSTGVSGKTMTVAVSGEKTNVGTGYTATASCSKVGSSTSECSNYTLKSTTTSTTFEITAYNLSNATIDDISALTYNGSAQKPAPVVKALSATLSSGTDYTVSYSNNTNAGTATVTVTGKGNYTGTKSKNFTINKKSVNVTWGSTTSFEYNGTERKPTASVTTGVTNETMTLNIAGGKTDAGENYTATASCKSVTSNDRCANYNLGNTTQSFTITKYDLSKATLGSISAYTYNGTDREPEPSVTVLTNVTLTKGTHFTYSYSNNRNAGTATVTVTAKDNTNYKGSQSKNFTINKAQPQGSVVCATLTYNGTNQSLISNENLDNDDVYYKVGTALDSSNYTTGSTTKPTAKDAGTYVVYWYAPEDANYQAKSGVAKLNSNDCSIGKASVTVTWGSKTSFTYTGSNQVPTVTTPVSTGVGSESMTVGVSGAQSAVGTYTATASCSSVTVNNKCSNYSISNPTKQFSIGKATPTITLSPTSGIIATGNTVNVTATVKSGVSGKTVSGTLSVTSGSTSYATISSNTTETITNADNTNGIAKTIKVYGKAKGQSVVTVKFEPDSSHSGSFNKAADKTYTATVRTKVNKPSCKTDLVYSGNAQDLVASGTGYTLSNNSRTVAGSQSVKANVSDTATYAWNDNTQSEITVGSCTIAKATPTITLSETSGVIATGKTRTFTATVKSNAINASVSGTLNTTSGSTSYATVSPNGNTTISSANNSTGVATTVTVSGVAKGSSTITVKFTVDSASSANFNNAANVTYTANARTQVALPAVGTYCKSLTYTGAAQTLVNTAGTGFAWKSGTTSGTNAGSYTNVTAQISDTATYAWPDNSQGEKKITCTIGKATPTITLNESSGIVLKNGTRTFTATVKSNAASGTVSGKLNTTSGTTSVATISPNGDTSISAANNSTGVATTVTVTGVANGSSAITVKFTPSDTTNYNSASNKTYTAYTRTSVTIPAAGTYCKSLTYTGAEQTLVNSAGTGFAWKSGTTTGTNAGNYTNVTAQISNTDNYAWSDKTQGEKKITCTIGKATPTITLNESSGVIATTKTRQFTATVKSGAVSGKVSGTLNTVSGTTTVATISPNGNTSITDADNSNGKATAVTVTSVAAGSSTITVKFTPSDTTNYNSASNKTYTATVKTKVNRPSCKSGLKYTGAAQELVTPNTTYYSLSNNSQTAVGTYNNIVATLAKSDYAWDNNTTSAYTVTGCKIEKQTPTITLEASSGIIATTKTRTVKATVKSGASSGTVSGTLTAASGSTSIATVDSNASATVTNANNSAGVAINVGLKGVAKGAATITFNFTPDSSNTGSYNSATAVKYTANVRTAVTKPSCKQNLVYTGSAQDLIASGTGYTLSNNSMTNAGSQTVTAKISDTATYAWADNTQTDYKPSCSIAKATPTITLSAENGIIATGKTRTFTATVKSGSNAKVSGKLNTTSGSTSYATISPSGDTTITDADNSSGKATTITITGVAKGSSTITVKFTPTDTTNFNSASNKTYTANVRTAVTKPSCKQNLVYTGSAQDLIASGTGYTLSNNSMTNAGHQNVTAAISDKSTYAWADNTQTDYKPSCYIAAATPTITLSASSGVIATGKTRTFTATVKSGSNAKVSGKLNTTSGSTSYATISPTGDTTITDADNSSGKATTITITGVAKGSSTINVKFTPTDTTNFNYPGNKLYIANVRTAVTKPSCKQNLVYTGSAQDLIASGTGYSLSNNSMTNAGSQTVTVAISDKSTYAWADSTQDDYKPSCSIAKATPTITLSASSGVVATGKTRTFTATVKSGSNAKVSGTLNTTSGSTGVATVSPNGNTTISNADNSTGVATNVTVTGVALGSSTITAKFTPTDTTNFNSAGNKTYTASVKTQIAVPTCKSGLTYSGSEQTLINTNSNYTLTNNARTVAGSQDVTAALASTNYAWPDSTTANKKVNCTIAKATPTITLSPTSGTIATGNTVSFTATVKSGASNASVSGTLNTTSGTTAAATVTPNGNTTISSANNSTGVATTVNVYGVAAGSSTITAKFTPSDTSNYNIATNKTYAATVKTKVTVPTCKSGLKYTGAAQELVTPDTSKYTLTNNSRTAAGSQSVTAALACSNCAWADNTTGNKTISNCTIAKATPTITLSPTSGIIATGNTVNVTATVKSGAASGTVSGSMTVASASTSYATISSNTTETISSANNSAGVAKTIKVYGKAKGQSKINVNFAPDSTSSSNYNSAAQVQYTANVRTKVAVPSCRTGLVYSGSAQNVVNTGTGYNLSGHSQTNAGSYNVTASISDTGTYAWADNSQSNKTISSCSIAKADPTITVTPTSGSVHTGAEITSLTYTASTNVLGKIEFTINGSTKHVTEKAVQDCTNTTSCTLQIQGNNSGTEGSNTISVKLTPSSYNYSNGVKYSDNWNSKTVNVTGSAVPTYWIKYNMNGGTGTIADQIKVKGTNLTLSSTVPTREGFAFQGWATSSTGSVVYAKGGTYTANGAATLFAVWKDSQHPSLTLEKWTYFEGFGIGVPFSYADTTFSSDYRTAYMNNTTAGVHLRYNTNGGQWYYSIRELTSSASPANTPNGGIFSSTSYHDYKRNLMADQYSTNNYVGNGWAAAVPLNTWKYVRNVYGRTDGIWGFDTVEYDLALDNYYGTGPAQFDNHRFWATDAYNSFYEIQARVTDNVGVTSVKYINASGHTAADCSTSGTSMTYSYWQDFDDAYYWANVTSNGTYYVCAMDAAGNSTTYSIVIDRIGTLKAIYPDASYYNVPTYYSELYYTADGYNQYYIPRVNGLKSDVGNYNVDTWYAMALNISQHSIINLSLDNRGVKSGSNSYYVLDGSPGWHHIRIFGGAATGSVDITNFTLNFGSSNQMTAYTIRQAIQNGMISPFIIYSSYNNSPHEGTYTADFNDFLDGHYHGLYPITDLYFKVNSGKNFIGVRFTSDKTWNTTDYQDGIFFYKFISSFDFSIHPFNSKFWTDNWSNTGYGPRELFDPVDIPNNAATIPTNLGWGRLFIRTLTSGRHEVCIRNMYDTSSSGATSNTTFCIAPNFWDTTKTADDNKYLLHNEYYKQTGHWPGSNWTDGTNCSSIQPNGTSGNLLYDCGIYADGTVSCRYMYKSGDWNTLSNWRSCTVYPSGWASCA